MASHRLFVNTLISNDADNKSQIYLEDNGIVHQVSLGARGACGALAMSPQGSGGLETSAITNMLWDERLVTMFVSLESHFTAALEKHRKKV